MDTVMVFRCLLLKMALTRLVVDKSIGGDLFAVPLNNKTDEQVSVMLSSGNANPSSHVYFGHAISAAWDALPFTVMEPVGNSGFWKCISGNDVLSSNLEQQFKRPLPSNFVTEDVAEEVEVHKKQCLPSFAVGVLLHFKSCVESADDVTLQVHREAQLQKVLKHWLVIILPWSTGRKFVQCVTGCDSVNSKLIMLGVVFRGKAPGTWSKRANSLKILCEQLERIGLSFPCSEASLYGVLCELRRTGAPPSRSKGLLEAIAFVRFTMGIIERDKLLRGQRCWGAVTSDASLQHNQASPLQVKELDKLHNIFENRTDKWDRKFSGKVLFVVYSRARWSDAQHGANVNFDEDYGDIKYVEVLTSLHTTMRVLQHKLLWKTGLLARGPLTLKRLLLGYPISHFSRGLTYSRDGMARPLEILGNVLEEIRNGLHFPDCTRSGRLYKTWTTLVKQRRVQHVWMSVSRLESVKMNPFKTPGPQ